jgi:predicted Holliday junction resolvase-like endonuclease
MLDVINVRRKLMNKKEIKEFEQRWKGRTEPTEDFIKWLNSEEAVKQREQIEKRVKEIKDESNKSGS